jgi:hypothetical protein
MKSYPDPNAHFLSKFSRNAEICRKKMKAFNDQNNSVQDEQINCPTKSVY